MWCIALSPLRRRRCPRRTALQCTHRLLGKDILPTPPSPLSPHRPDNKPARRALSPRTRLDVHGMNRLGDFLDRRVRGVGSPPFSIIIRPHPPRPKFPSLLAPLRSVPFPFLISLENNRCRPFPFGGGAALIWGEGSITQVGGKMDGQKQRPRERERRRATDSSA